MTAQMPDQFLYQNNIYFIAGIRGSGLTKPQDFGILPISYCTACYRGYVMKYSILGKKLILKGFLVKVEKNTPMPEINGKAPIRLKRGDELFGIFSYDYHSLNYKIPFTGSLWIGKDFIDTEYVHMGFSGPSGYQTVLKFTFKDGDLINAEDISKEIEKARKKGDPKGYRPKSMNEKDIQEWIHDRFSLDPHLD